MQVYQINPYCFRESKTCFGTNCNTPGATKAQDVTNVPSLMPEYKTQQQKTNIKVKQESDKNKTIIK